MPFTWENKINGVDDAMAADVNALAAAILSLIADLGGKSSAAEVSAAIGAAISDITSEVTNARTSAIKSLIYASIDARIEAAESDIYFPATNLVTNGDFSNGTTGWEPAAATLSIASNVLSVTGNGGYLAGYGYYLSASAIQVASKYYIRAMARVTNTLCSGIHFLVQGSAVADSLQIKQILTPTQNTWYPMSGVITPNAGATGFLKLQINHEYTTAGVENGKVMEVKQVLAIDLTATFGAGNEPTITEMDAIMTYFPDSWFNGTINMADQKWFLKYLLNTLRAKAALSSPAFTDVPTAPTAAAGINTTQLANTAFVAAAISVLAAIVVPNTRTINAKALSANIALSPDDLDDASTTHKFISAGDATKLSNLSNTNSGDETKATIESKLTGNITSHDHHEPWEGVLVACDGDGDPNRMLLMMNQNVIEMTPTLLTASLARVSYFKLSTAITFNKVRYFGIGSTANIHQLALYNGDTLARIWTSGTFTTSAQAWGALGSALNITLAAGQLYFIAVSSNTTGTTAGIKCYGATAGRIGVVPKSWPASLDVDGAIISPYAAEAQFTVTTGALPDPAATIAARGSMACGFPAIFLDSNNA